MREFLRTREKCIEKHEAQPSASRTSRVFLKIPKCLCNLTMHKDEVFYFFNEVLTTDQSKRAQLVKHVKMSRPTFFDSPHINATKFYVQNGSEFVWSNKTVKWTYNYYIFAVDGGSPKRGDRIPLNITFDVTCEKTGAVVADAITGEVFFRAPGLTGSIYRKEFAYLSFLAIHKLCILRCCK